MTVHDAKEIADRRVSGFSEAEIVALAEGGAVALGQPAACG